jgi:hypothetical protein
MVIAGAIGVLLAAMGVGAWPLAARQAPATPEIRLASAQGEFTTGGILYGVAAFSTNNALAVGMTSAGPRREALIVRWNGTAWKQVGGLARQAAASKGVTVVSAREAWAVGGTSAGKTILHWNGVTWK